MASPTRPYFVTFQGKDHLVEAISQEQAISLVVAPHVSGVRAAKAGEVMTFMLEQQKAVTSPNEDQGDGISKEPAAGDDVTGDGTGEALPPIVEQRV